MAVHQLLSYARRGDATSNFALDLRSALGGPDRSELVAHAFDESVEDDVTSLVDVEQSGITDDDLVLYHLSIGCGPAVDWLLSRSGPFGIYFHNITPSAFFEGLSHDHARLTAQGREELARLVPQAELIVTNSAFTAAEVEALGGSVDAIQPPVTTTRRLVDIPDDPQLARNLAKRKIPDLISIGQSAPHKRPHELVFAHHLMVTHIGTEATLSLIGAAPVPSYQEVVSRTVELLALHLCKPLGPLSDTELATRLRQARALVSMSVHEGFCVPVVEAMACGIPVIACDAGAVAETAGGAALLLPPDASPMLVAEALHTIVTDDALAADLRRRGLRRAEEMEALTDPSRLVAVLADHA